MNQRKHARRQSAGRRGARDSASDELSGAGMGAMGFDRHRASCRKCRGSVAPSRRKREGKIAGPEHHHRPHGNQHPPEIRPRQRLAIRQRQINPRVDPRSFSHHVREQTKLAAGSRALTLQTPDGQSGFGVGALDEPIAKPFDFSRNGLEKRRPHLAADRTILGKRLGCRRHRVLHIGVGCFVKIRIETFAGRGIHRTEYRAASSSVGAGDETEACELRHCDDLNCDGPRRPRRGKPKGRRAQRVRRAGVGPREQLIKLAANFN